MHSEALKRRYIRYFIVLSPSVIFTFLLYKNLQIPIIDTHDSILEDNNIRHTVHDEILNGTQRKHVTYFNVKKFTMPLTFSIKEAVEKHLQEGTPLPDTTVNLHPYSYIFRPSTCAFQTLVPVNILVLVKSFAGNIEQRTVLRKLMKNVTKKGVNFVFMLGFSARHEAKIRQENAIFQDIIQEDFLDTYRNNTLKIIMGFNWAVKYCPDVQLFMFLDDDYFVKWDKIIPHLTKRYHHTKRNVFYGRLVSSASPYRDKESPWHVDENIYPFTRYPAYIAGGAFVVSADVAKKFQLAFPYVRYLSIDDTYLGIVAEILSIVPRNSGRFNTFAKECSHIPSDLYQGKCHKSFYEKLAKLSSLLNTKNILDFLNRCSALIERLKYRYQNVTNFFHDLF